MAGIEPGRYELNRKLVEIMSYDKTDRIKVFYSPDEKSSLTYPCIVYTKKFTDTKEANNSHYISNVAYNVSVLSRTPGDDTILRAILDTFPNSRHDNEFIESGINHSVVTVYYRL